MGPSGLRLLPALSGRRRRIREQIDVVPVGGMPRLALAVAAHGVTQRGVGVIGNDNSHDLPGRVSPRLGDYPKCAHMADQLRRMAAAEIAVRSRSELPQPELRGSVCQAHTDVGPPEMMRIATCHRLRGDRVITEVVRQYEDPQRRGEDPSVGGGAVCRNSGAVRCFWKSRH